MKVLLLLFLVFITYSQSIDIQRVTTDNSLMTLRASKNEDYFYVSLDKKPFYYHHYLYLLLLDNGYNINQISYCNVDNYPTQSPIDSCSFIPFSYYFSDSQIKSSGKLYFYKKYISSRDSYIIIKYSGNDNSGTFKATASYENFIKSINLDSSSDTEIKTLEDRNNYLFTYIGHPNSNYLYFYIKDRYQLLENPIYYCITSRYPNYNFDCTFYSLCNDEKNPNSDYDYLYRVNVSNAHGPFIILKYFVGSSNGLLNVKISSSKPLSTVAIVFIIIGSLVFVGIIIGLIVYFCKRKASRNLAYAPTQPAEMISTPISFIGFK